MSITQQDVDTLWSMCDKNNDGGVTFDEFKEGFNAYLGTLGKGPSSESDLKIMFGGIDASMDRDKKITKAELENELLHKQERMKGLTQQFKEFSDMDGKNGLTKDELKTAVRKAKLVPEGRLDNYVDMVFSIADSDGSGLLDLDEYVEIMNTL